MTDLREQLHHAKAEYEDLRYPGDLAGDVLPRAARRIWPTMATIAAVAVAAVVALAVWLNTPVSAPKQISRVSPVAPATNEKVVTDTVSEEIRTDFPDGVTVVPTLESMGLSQAPSMPSFDEMMSSSTATTREAS